MKKKRMLSIVWRIFSESIFFCSSEHFLINPNEFSFTQGKCLVNRICFTSKYVFVCNLLNTYRIILWETYFEEIIRFELIQNVFLIKHSLTDSYQWMFLAELELFVKWKWFKKWCFFFQIIDYYLITLQEFFCSVKWRRAQNVPNSSPAGRITGQKIRSTGECQSPQGQTQL